MLHNKESILISILNFCLSGNFKREYVDDDNILINKVNITDVTKHLEKLHAIDKQAIEKRKLKSEIEKVIQSIQIKYQLGLEIKTSNQAPEDSLGKEIGAEFTSNLFESLYYSDQFNKYAKPNTKIAECLLEKSSRKNSGLFIKRSLLKLFKEEILKAIKTNDSHLINSILLSNHEISSPSLQNFVNSFAESVYSKIEKFLYDPDVITYDNQMTLINSIVKETESGMIINHTKLLKIAKEIIPSEPNEKTNTIDKDNNKNIENSSGGNDGGGNDGNGNNDGSMGHGTGEGISQLISHPLLFSLPDNELKKLINNLFD
jgi:hypothetical protein